MPLIFAVDNDKRQSAQLASLLRSHVDADLVQSATVLDGIGVLQGRIPDLVLTSSLLSPRDESALANHMRELGPRAAHVHTLTIPVLATDRKASKRRPSGVLGALRRERGSEVEVAGCQPEVFAQEVRIYLERTVEHRGGTGDGMDAEPSTARPDPPVETAAIIETDRTEVIAHETSGPQPPAVEADAFTPPETRVPVVDMSTFDDLDSLAAQLAAPSGAAPTARGPAIDPFEPFTAIDGDAEASTEPTAVATPAVASDTWFDRMSATVRQETPEKPAAPPAPEPVFSWIDNQTVSSLSDVLSRVRASNADTYEHPFRSLAAISQAPALVVPVVTAAPIELVVPVVPEQSTPEREVSPSAAPVETAPESAPTPISATARPEIMVDLVLPPAAPFLDPDVLAMFGAAAHRAGLDALESLSRTTRIDGALVALPAPGPERAPRVTRESKAERRSRRKGPKPAQDEWGMYDPNQCGPAALFDEEAWSEVDTEEKVPARRPRAS